MRERKGIILAGGSGSRLFPITKGISKQLLPVFDKPMIYYPLTTLMEAGIRDIVVISNFDFLPLFKNLLGDGSHLGININYLVQENPDGIAQAFLLAEKFIDGFPSALILGDNLFYGDKLHSQLLKSNANSERSTIYTYRVKNPERYGVINFDSNFNIDNIEEKPQKPKSSYAITGLYFYDSKVVEKAKTLSPSSRGELEITDLNNLYIKDNLLDIENIGSGSAWFDTGTFESLHEASSYIRTMQNRQSLMIGCPEQVAWNNKWISDEDLYRLALPLTKSGYGNFLIELLNK